MSVRELIKSKDFVKKMSFYGLAGPVLKQFRYVLEQDEAPPRWSQALKDLVFDEVWHECIDSGLQTFVDTYAEKVSFVEKCRKL